MKRWFPPLRFLLVLIFCSERMSTNRKCFDSVHFHTQQQQQQIEFINRHNRNQSSWCFRFMLNSIVALFNLCTFHKISCKWIFLFFFFDSPFFALNRVLSVFLTWRGVPKTEEEADRRARNKEDISLTKGQELGWLTQCFIHRVKTRSETQIIDNRVSRRTKKCFKLHSWRFRIR